MYRKCIDFFSNCMSLHVSVPAWVSYLLCRCSKDPGLFCIFVLPPYCPHLRMWSWLTLPQERRKRRNREGMVFSEGTGVGLVYVSVRENTAIWKQTKLLGHAVSSWTSTALLTRLYTAEVSKFNTLMPLLIWNFNNLKMFAISRNSISTLKSRLPKYCPSFSLGLFKT